MAQRARKGKNRSKQKSNARAIEQTAPPPQKTPAWIFWVGFLALLVAIVPTLMLVLKHFDLMQLAGCGEGQGCDQAQKSVWAKVPGLNWPVANLGLAFFMAMALGWILFAGDRMTRLFRLFALSGALVSGMFLVVIVININNYLCWYCVTSHLANLVFVMMVLLTKPAPAASAPKPMAIFATVASTWLVTTGVLFGVDQTVASRIEERAKSNAEDSVKNILAGDNQISGFVGRYVRGANPAKVRLVMFTGYQCPDCQRLEDEVMHILATRNDVAVSIKQFPLNSDCNGNMGSAMHKNACWAARCAETAGLLRGAHGFWQMHDALFKRKGEFNESSLPTMLIALGYEPNQFLNLMKSQQTLDLVVTDTVEGGRLGIVQTPTVFINGVEFKGVEVVGALTNAVNKIAAQVTTAGNATDDVPQSGELKMVNDWSEATVPILYPRSDAIHYGERHETAKLRIIVWGDYQSIHCRNMDTICRERVAKQAGVSYTYLHFPLHLDCNARIGKTKFDYSCTTVRATHAAYALGGVDALMKMHEMLFANFENISPEFILDTAADIGLDRAVFQAEIQSGKYDQIMASDVLDASTRNVRGIPMLIVNEKRLVNYALDRVPRPDVVFDHIIGPVDAE